jgi:chromosome segregation ATPase
MYEVSIWVPIVLAEVSLLGSGTLGFLLWKSRKAEQRLRREVAALQQVRHQHPEPAPTLAALPGESTSNMALPAAVAPGQNGDDAVADDQALEHTTKAMQRMIGHLQEKSHRLQQQVETLQAQQTLAPEDRQQMLSLRKALREVREELQVLQQANMRLKENLSEKAKRLKMGEQELGVFGRRFSLQRNAVKELRRANARLAQEVETKSKLLEDLTGKMTRYQDIKAENASLREQANKLAYYIGKDKELEALKQELWRVKTQLAQREADLHRVQGEYDTLTLEYQRLFKDYQL